MLDFVPQARYPCKRSGSVAQSVEQGIENPRVGGSIPSRATILSFSREVAQPGGAPALGAGCRRFESCLPDHFKNCCRDFMCACVRSCANVWSNMITKGNIYDLVG